jgi:hypothetical protein
VHDFYDMVVEEIGKASPEVAQAIVSGRTH